MFYVTFWDIASRCLPLGLIRKQRLSIREVQVLVARAHKEGTLVCVAQVDLEAPYERATWKRHVELCKALCELSIYMSIDDFFGEVSCNSLQLAKVNACNSLLLVDCCYVTRSPPHIEHRPVPGSRGQQGLVAWSSMFTIDPATISFDLYTMTGGRSAL